MTFYQELQLSSTGSKQLIKNTTDKKEKTRHITIKKHIKADELAGDYIAFYAYNSAINVYINDVQVYSE